MEDFINHPCLPNDSKLCLHFEPTGIYADESIAAIACRNKSGKPSKIRHVNIMASRRAPS
jgi:hypothetical protein